MSPDAAAALIAGGGLVLSVCTSLVGASFVAGARTGRTDARLDVLEGKMSEMATKEQLAGVTRDLAEIKGMFRMTLREPDGR